MNDKEFVLALLGQYGQEVAGSTLEFIKNRITAEAYMDEAHSQLKRYGKAFLEWKENGCGDNSSQDRRDSQGT